MEKRINSISAIWKSNKKTSVEECSKNILEFLLLLKNHNEKMFSQWYEKGRSKEEALEKKINLEQAYFKNALNRKWDKKFEDLGVRVSYWTGDADENKSAEISFNLGAYGNKPFNKNLCVITLPEENEYYNSEANKESLIRLVVDYWKPDKVLINGDAIENLNTIL
ncbi:MAG TPA: Imm52 family immunity protein [Salinimicrobium sp.]|nr:Imm52 family immunity protein [Salinimicrobium sp.]